MSDLHAAINEFGKLVGSKNEASSTVFYRWQELRPMIEALLAAGVGVPPDATTTHAADGRVYSERDYIDRTIATIRQHEPHALRESWWTGAALALADEVDRLRAGVGEARPRCPSCYGDHGPDWKPEDGCLALPPEHRGTRGEARPAEPAASVAETMKGQLP